MTWHRHSTVAWDWQRQSRRELHNHLEKHPVAHGFSLFKQPSTLRRTSSSTDPESALLIPVSDEGEVKRRKTSVFGLPLVLDSHWLRLVQLIVMGFIDAIYTAFKVPITFALFPELDIWSVSSLIDIAAGFFFTADIIVNFHIAKPQKAPKGERKPLIPDGRGVAKQYILHGGFFIDLIATIPAYIELGANILHNQLHFSLEILSLLRLFRLLRLGRFIQGVFVVSLGGQLGKKLLGFLPVSYLYMMNILYAMLVLINLMGCAWLFTAETEGSHLSWLIDVDGVDIHDASSFTKYISALHFATTTMATVGYGDVSPKNNLERSVAMAIMVVGVIFFGFMINALGELLAHAGKTARRATLLHNKIQDVETWMSSRDLPRKLRQETVAYFCDAWVAQADVHESELLAEMPRHLRGKIISELLAPVFEQSELMKDLDAPALQMLCAAMKPQPLLPGHDLCHPGDKAESLWILQKGVIAAVSKDGTHDDVLYAPALLGEASLLIDKYPGCASRTCGFRAQEASMVWELKMEDLNGLLFMHPRLKNQMLDGFNQAMQNRLQDNPRARWRRAVAKLNHVMHGGTKPTALEEHLGSHIDDTTQDFNSESEDGESQDPPRRFQHSMDIMYDAETADLIAEHIGNILKKEANERAAKQEDKRQAKKEQEKENDSSQDRAAKGQPVTPKRVSFKQRHDSKQGAGDEGSSGLHQPLLSPFRSQ